MERKKGKKMSISGSYVLKDEDALLINRVLARIDRAIDIYEHISKIEYQRLEMEIRDSMSRTVARSGQQAVINKISSYLTAMAEREKKQEKDSEDFLRKFGNVSLRSVPAKTKGKKITAKDKRL